MDENEAKAITLGFGKALLQNHGQPGLNQIDKDKIAELLRSSPEALEKFEAAYKARVLNNPEASTGSLLDTPKPEFDKNIFTKISYPGLNELISRIIDELLEQTEIIGWDGYCPYRDKLSPETQWPRRLEPEDVNKIPEDIRPQLTGYLLKRDTPGPSYPDLLFYYDKFMSETRPKEKFFAYHSFRQGLDILDLDEILYEMLGLNKNSMGYWFPALCGAIRDQDLLKIPKTKIAKIPMPLLQLARLDYMSLNPTTLKILDGYCAKAFGLDMDKDYFVKTGVYSSKFDFRNAHVTGSEEIKTLGEYLLFIHFQATMMAGPLSTPSIYGAATTREWVVREFVPDPEDNPTIYKGLPLRTEYRVFIDVDDNKILGMSPYWEPGLMKKRFGNSSDSDSNPHLMHDYITFKANETRLLDRYIESKDRVASAVGKMLPSLKSNGLSGQWSLDIMQSGNDLYAIDMALAENSALIECVPKELLRPAVENWLPDLSAITGNAKGD